MFLYERTNVPRKGLFDRRDTHVSYDLLYITRRLSGSAALPATAPATPLRVLKSGLSSCAPVQERPGNTHFPDRRGWDAPSYLRRVGPYINNLRNPVSLSPIFSDSDSETIHTQAQIFAEIGRFGRRWPK